MLDWCSVCEKAIPPTKHTLLVPPPDVPPVIPPPLPVPSTTKGGGHGKGMMKRNGGGRHGKMAGRKAQVPVKAAEVVVEDVEVDDEDDDEEQTATTTTSTTAAPRRRTIISQEPSALYCSEECRLKDEANNNLQQLSSLLHPMGSPPSPHTSPPSPILVSGSAPRYHREEFDWESANGDYFHRVFHAQQHHNLDQDDKDTEARLRALMQATSGAIPNLSQIQRSLSTPRLSRSKVVSPERTLSDTIAVTSHATASSSESVPSLSEDGHSTDHYQKKDVSPAQLPPPRPTTPSSHQHRPTFLQMTSLAKPSHSDKSVKSGKSSRSKTGLTPSASQTNIASTHNNLKPFVPGSAPAVIHPPPPPPSHEPPPALHYGGVSTLDLYAVGYPLAFGSNRSRSTQKIHSRHGSHGVITDGYASTNGSAYNGYDVTHSEQITPTQSLLLPGRSRRSARSGSGSSVDSSRSRRADEEGLVMKKRSGGDRRHGSSSQRRDSREGRRSAEIRSSVPVAIGGGSFGGSQRKMTIGGAGSSFTGERDKAALHHPLHSQSRSSSCASTRPQSHATSADVSIPRPHSGSRYPPRPSPHTRSSSYISRSSYHHAPLSSSPLSSAHSPVHESGDSPFPLTRTTSRLSESVISSQDGDEHSERVLVRRPSYQRNNSSPSKAAPSTMVPIPEPPSPTVATGAGTGGWSWTGTLSGRIKSFAGLGDEMKESQPKTTTSDTPRNVSPTTETKPRSESISSKSLLVPDVSPKRTTSFGAGFASLFGVWGLSMAGTGGKDKSARSSVGSGSENGGSTTATTPSPQDKQSHIHTAKTTSPTTNTETPSAATNPTTKNNEASTANVPLSMMLGDMPRAKKPLAPLKVDIMSQSPKTEVVQENNGGGEQMVIVKDYVHGKHGRGKGVDSGERGKRVVSVERKGMSPGERRRSVERGKGQSPVSPHDRHPGMPPRSNWDPELVEQVKSSRRMSREMSSQRRHSHRSGSGYVSPFYVPTPTFDRSPSPPPTPGSSTGRTSGRSHSYSHHHPPLPVVDASVHLPRSKSNHSITSTTSSRTGHRQNPPVSAGPYVKSNSSTVMPRGMSMTSLSSAAGHGSQIGSMYGPPQNGIYGPPQNGGGGMYATTGHHHHVPSSHGGGLRATSSQPYVNRWFSTSPSAGGSAFGSPSAGGMYHPAEGLHGANGNGGFYGAPQRKKEKDIGPMYPVLALPTGTRKKLVWKKVRREDGTEEDVQVEGDEEEDVYEKRKRLFYFDR